MTLGRLVYLLYHRPVGRVKTCLREGGPLEQWRTERGRREMEAAAWRLTSIGPRDHGTTGLRDGGKPLEIHMLVGTRFWFMAAYALVSLQRQVDRAVHVHFYDDGTLEARQREKLETLAAAVTFHDRAGIDQRIERYLPEEKFPFIRERLRNYPNLKKLTDPHVGSTGPKLVLDADILFFNEPTEIVQWSDQPKDILCASDVTESYGYSRNLMQMLAGGLIPEKVNVGITGLRSEKLDWDKLERWCGVLVSREGKSYYLEQALVAMLCAIRPVDQLAIGRYITGPKDEQVLVGEGVMQHYVDLSKKNYFRHAWRQFAGAA